MTNQPKGVTGFSMRPETPRCGNILKPLNQLVLELLRWRRESEGSQGGSQFKLPEDADNESSVIQPDEAEKSRHVFKKRTPGVTMQSVTNRKLRFRFGNRTEVALTERPARGLGMGPTKMSSRTPI